MTKEYSVDENGRDDPYDIFGQLTSASYVPEKYSGERKYPFVVDIFLYPFSKSGLIMLAIFVGIPVILRLMVLLFTAITIVFVPFLVFLGFVKIAGIIIGAVLWIYIFWYYGQCVADSAVGGVRAPSIVAAPTLGEMFFNFLRIALTSVMFLVPAAIWFEVAGRLDYIFWMIAGVGILILPMAVLAWVMFDSMTALNPILLAGSIASTFLPYLGVYLLIFLSGYLLVLSVIALSAMPLVRVFIQGICTLWLMITGHLVGRFFYKYQDRLNWDV